jgi:hypothetical protein
MQPNTTAYPLDCVGVPSGMGTMVAKYIATRAAKMCPTTPMKDLASDLLYVTGFRDFEASTNSL